MRTIPVSMAVSVLFALGCSQGQEDVVVSSHRLASTTGASGMRASVLGDTLAADAFTNAKADLHALAGNSGLAVYEIQLPGDDLQQQARSRGASVLGVEASAVSYEPHPNPLYPVVTARNGALELSVNLKNGTEFYQDTARFHTGKGVPKEKLLPQATYIDKAASYAESRLASYMAGKQFYPYRVSTYYTGGASASGERAVEEARQVAVVFNERIGGIPIIGPGGKLVVHLTHDGDVLAHRATTAPIKGTVRSLGYEDLLTSDEAFAKAIGRLTRAGLTLDDVTVERSEFGYLRYNHNAQQRYLAPHYAFFFKPLPNKGTKTLVEIIPAVKTPDLLALVESDKTADDTRKAAIRALAVQTQSGGRR